MLNTHLDDRSDNQRRLAGTMVRMRARYEAATSGEPVIVTGDFNSPPSGTDSGAYRIATGAEPPTTSVNATFAQKYAVADDVLPDFVLQDLRAHSPRHLVSRNYATWIGFGAPTNTSEWSRIDFIFGGSNGGWCVFCAGRHLCWGDSHCRAGALVLTRLCRP